MQTGECHIPDGPWRLFRPPGIRRSLKFVHKLRAYFFYAGPSVKLDDSRIAAILYREVLEKLHRRQCARLRVVIYGVAGVDGLFVLVVRTGGKFSAAHTADEFSVFL